MKKAHIILALLASGLVLLGSQFKTRNQSLLMKESFIEITVQNHVILHGFDANNKEIIEEVKVDKPSKKIVAINRILSVGEKYILTSYAFDRHVYWEYHESYEDIKKRITAEGQND